MKLKRENFKRQQFGDLTTYSYECNGMTFFLQVQGQGVAKTIHVFKGSIDAREDNFETKDTLEAWNKLEEYLTACESEQGSSGGFKKPQEMPNVLPLLAIKRAPSGNWSITMFVIVDNKQAELFNTEVDGGAITTPIPDTVFEVNWSAEDVPAIIKCEVLMKKYDQVKFENDDTADVFLFIPKSIVDQGGEEGGNTEGGEEGGQEGKGQKGKGKPQKGGENGSDEGGEEGGDEGGEEGGDEDGGQKGKGKGKGEGKETDEEEDTENKGKGKGKKGKKSEEKGDEDGQGEGEGDGEGEEGEDSEEGNPNDDQEREGQTKAGKGVKDTGKELKLEFSDTINRLSEATGTSQSLLLNVFRNVKSGETFLMTRNFNKIKQSLGLPDSVTARQLSESIINSK